MGEAASGRFRSKGLRAVPERLLGFLGWLARANDARRRRG
jgi:hypothetical protein